MIGKQITDKVLTLSIDYMNPRGGISQVLYTYSQFYETFNFITTTPNHNKSTLYKAWVFAKAYARYLAVLARRGIKIVHIHGASGVSFWRKAIFIKTAKVFGVKVIYHIHGGAFKDFTKQHPRIVRHVVNQADCIVALSQTWAEYFREQYPGKDVHIVNNPVEKPAYAPCKDDSRLSLCFLGKICDEKGIFDLLQVIADNQGDYRGRLRLRIGGNGEVDRLKTYIAQRGLADIVTYEGWISGQAKSDLLNQVHALALPSYYEGLPICMLEAMSYGDAVLATPVGGITEVLSDQQNGYLVAPGDLQGLKRALDFMVGHIDQVKAVGQASRKSIANHQVEHIERALEHIYSSLLQDKK